MQAGETLRGRAGCTGSLAQAGVFTVDACTLDLGPLLRLLRGGRHRVLLPHLPQ